ncbi:hypothetical protein [Streptomyces sp. ScaeMP-e48]|uniref:hypothetical protein n=1 Tax=Streptomyces sp. ScaeMP-e48 TaxID=1100823 RepID=UPI00117CD22D|nr:hypothetical protein [Streptomyces sp. ScaeMP-e48]
MRKAANCGMVHTVLAEVMDRLLAVEPQRSDGSLTVTSLAHEAASPGRPLTGPTASWSSSGSVRRMLQRL